MSTAAIRSGSDRVTSEVELSLVLDRERSVVVGAASESIRQSRTRYETAERDETRRRLDALYDQLCAAVASRDLTGISEFARQLGAQRFRSGYDLSEVQSAINALEEAAWRTVCAQLPSDQHALALGLVSTVLGTAKAELAREYVSLASRTHVQSLDLRALFSGDAGA
jgi:RsbT co-antagonist protein rsbRD N-terminal domain